MRVEKKKRMTRKKREEENVGLSRSGSKEGKRMRMKRRMEPKDIVIRAGHTGAESGSSNTKHDGRKTQQINGECAAQRSVRPVTGSLRLQVREQSKQNDEEPSTSSLLSNQI